MVIIDHRNLRKCQQNYYLIQTNVHRQIFHQQSFHRQGHFADNYFTDRFFNQQGVSR
jgi:hypothetical protein